MYLEVWEGILFWGEGLHRKEGLRSGDLGSALRRKCPVLRAKNENGFQQTGPSGETDWATPSLMAECHLLL